MEHHKKYTYWHDNFYKEMLSAHDAMMAKRQGEYAFRYVYGTDMASPEKSSVGITRMSVDNKPDNPIEGVTYINTVTNMNYLFKDRKWHEIRTADPSPGIGAGVWSQIDKVKKMVYKKPEKIILDHIEKACQYVFRHNKPTKKKRATRLLKVKKVKL